ncbi:MAG: hypothetical protein M3Q29_22050 [Chloroflexota bacterium]|nr:hypothetical protein [Chloroflexota bacterium]
MANVIERGDIYFFYRPRKGEEHPTGLDEIQRAYFILSPKKGGKHRLLVLGHKKLPEIVPGETSGEERVWAFIAAVSEDPRDLLKDLGAAVEGGEESETSEQLPRPAGEGKYALVGHEDHTHLAYALELPRDPGPVQEELDIGKQASYVISVKNPEQRTRRAGLDEAPEYPKELRELFGKHNWIAVRRPELLDYENVQVLLIGAREDPEKELGVKLSPEKETEASAEIFSDLKLDREREPVAPLTKGEWR